MAFHSIADLKLQLMTFMDCLQFGAALHLSHHHPPSQANAPIRSITKFNQDTKSETKNPILMAKNTH